MWRSRPRLLVHQFIEIINIISLIIQTTPICLRVDQQHLQLSPNDSAVDLCFPIMRYGRLILHVKQLVTILLFRQVRSSCYFCLQESTAELINCLSKLIRV